jgi:hypothetical protein
MTSDELERLANQAACKSERAKLILIDVTEEFFPRIFRGTERQDILNKLMDAAMALEVALDNVRRLRDELLPKGEQ